jgi:uncharacterized membrane protein
VTISDAVRSLIRAEVLLLQLLCLTIWPLTGHAVTLPEVGRDVSGSLDLLGKHIPLPAGEWRVASAGFGRVTDDVPGPYGAIGAVLLVRPPDQPAQEFLLVQTNVLPVREGWGQPSECTMPDALFQNTTEPRNLHFVCSFVIATRPNRLIRSDLPALPDAKTVERLLPSWALVVGYRVSDRRDVLDVRYGVMPRAPRPGGWFVAKDAMDGAHRAVIARLGEWTLQARQTALAALRDPARQVPPLPQLPFDGQAAIKPPAEEISALRLALYKLATYRLPATTVSLTLGTILTGSLYTGAVLSFWQGLSHSTVYFSNELAWEWPRPTPEMPFLATQPTPLPGALPPAAEIPNRTQLAASGKLPPLPTTPMVFAETPAFVGAKARAVFIVDGKHVPLPDGGWIVLARDADTRATGTVLGLLDGKVLRGLIVIHTNPNKMTGIFGASSECARSDSYFAAVRYDTPEDGYCTYGKQIAPDAHADGDSLWGKALAQLSADGVAPPPAFMMVGARARTRENFLDIRYYFLPDPVLMHRDHDDTGLTPDPLAALQTWADLAQEPIELGVRGRSPVAGHDLLPWPWQVNAVNDALVWQARAPLEELASVGVLDETALLHQLALADNALRERERQRWSLWDRSAFKVATYRIASYVDSVTVTFLVTGSIEQSVGYASINAFIYPVIAYVNEISWAHSGIGKAPASLLSANFPDIGRDLR